jgi:hypothetical protein
VSGFNEGGKGAMDGAVRERKRVEGSKQDVCDWRPNPPLSERVNIHPKKWGGFESKSLLFWRRVSGFNEGRKGAVRGRGSRWRGIREGVEGANRMFATGDRIPSSLEKSIFPQILIIIPIFFRRHNFLTLSIVKM